MPGLGLGLRIQQRPVGIRPGGLWKACVVGGLEGWCAGNLLEARESRGLRGRRYWVRHPA